MPPSQSRTSPSGCTRGSSTASRSGSPRSSAATTTCTIAERIRADPDDPARARPRRPAEHERRRHHARLPHARRLTQRADVEVGLAQHVVEVHARARYHDARAAARRTGQGRGVAVGVEHADVGCPGGARPSGIAGIHFRSRPAPADGPAAVERALERRRALGVGGAQGGRDPRHRGGREDAGERRSGREHGQRVRDQGAARGWRRVRHERPLAVGERHRAAADRAVGGEVGERQGAARGRLVGGQGVRRLAVGELAGAIGRDALERVRERRIARDLARAQRARPTARTRARPRATRPGSRSGASITSACAAVISTPARASAIAGRASSPRAGGRGGDAQPRGPP